MCYASLNNSAWQNVKGMLYLQSDIRKQHAKEYHLSMKAAQQNANEALEAQNIADELKVYITYIFIFSVEGTDVEYHKLLSCGSRRRILPSRKR